MNGDGNPPRIFVRQPTLRRRASVKLCIKGKAHRIHGPGLESLAQVSNANHRSCGSLLEKFRKTIHDRLAQRTGCREATTLGFQKIDGLGSRNCDAVLADDLIHALFDLKKNRVLGRISISSHAELKTIFFRIPSLVV